MGRHIGAVLTRPYRGDDATDAARFVGRVTAVLSMAAGVIHFSAAGDHTSLPVMLAGFVAVATLQVALGGLLLWRRPSRLLIAGAIALMLGSAAVWLVSRTSGLPFLRDGHMEPIGFKDGICVLFELATVPGLLLLLSRDLANLTLPSMRLPSQALGAVTAVTCALMVPALLLEGGEHHTHEEAVALGIHAHGGGGVWDRFRHAGAAHASERDHARAPDHHSPGGRHSKTAALHSASGAQGHTQLASLHTGGSGIHLPGATGDHDATGHDDDRQHARRRHRDRHKGDGKHKRGGKHKDDGKHKGDDPHAGHDGDEDSADESPLTGLAAVCDVVGVVTDVCSR